MFVMGELVKCIISIYHDCHGRKNGEDINFIFHVCHGGRHSEVICLNNEPMVDCNQ